MQRDISIYVTHTHTLAHSNIYIKNLDTYGMYLSLGCICYSTVIREIELDMRKNTHKRNATTKYLVHHDKRHKRIEQMEGGWKEE